MSRHNKYLDGIVQIITQIVVLTLKAENMPKSQKSIAGISKALLTLLTIFLVCGLIIASFQTTLRNETKGRVFFVINLES